MRRLFCLVSTLLLEDVFECTFLVSLALMPCSWRTSDMWGKKRGKNVAFCARSKSTYQFAKPQGGVRLGSFVLQTQLAHMSLGFK